MFCLKNVLDGRNETLKATLFLVVAVRDPRILDLMILDMILAQGDIGELGGGMGRVLKEILQKIFFAIVLWESFSEVPRTRPDPG